MITAQGIKVLSRLLPEVPLRLQLRLLYFLSFIQGLETFHVEAGVVYEYIVALLVRNESVTLLVVEPLNCTFHYDTSKKYKKMLSCK